jgi:hypothetical protein
MTAARHDNDHHRELESEIVRIDRRRLVRNRTRRVFMHFIFMTTVTVLNVGIQIKDATEDHKTLLWWLILSGLNISTAAFAVGSFVAWRQDVREEEVVALEEIPWPR